jgi:molecular chaperone HtpG
MQEKGTISIHTENIFPIIKKFLYSDHEIFLRELVSNAIDATQKLATLASLGEYSGEIGEPKVKISLNKDAKTITVSDNGIGMTADEIKKYINQIAFSGATEFVEKYKDKEEAKQLIGHFGLGFYSAFMVSHKVQIITKSFRENAQPAQWTCDGSTEFEIIPTEKAERGSDIILHIAEDSEEFLDNFRLREILRKYCRFLPYPVELDGEVINNTSPIWTKSPNDLKDEDYLSFYKELYPTSEEPLFWIHLNVDYPFNLTGILYFPKVKNDFIVNKNKIQLYSKQVFITDEVKDVVPEFLMLLHGVIDSPDIPLNVSRSFLQADSNVKKINSYITKKVADKLAELFHEDRKAFENKWDSIGLFVKFGMISDEKFYDKAANFALLKNIENQYATIEEYKAKTSVQQLDKDNRLVWLYASDLQKQDTFIESAKKRSYDVLVLDGMIDSHFIQTLERKVEKLKVQRIDAETIDKLIDKNEKAELVLSDDEKNKLKEVYKGVANKEDIAIEALPIDEMPVVLTLPEFMRRMKEIAISSGMEGVRDLPTHYNVIVNGNHPLTQKILAETNEEKRKHLAQHAYDLALLSQNLLNGSALTKFINRSIDFVDAQ